MKFEPDQPSNCKNDQDKEEINHKYMRYFMRKGSTEEIFALGEEVERKLFNISFIDNQDKYTIEGIFPDIPTDPIVEEKLEKKWHYDVDNRNKRELVEEELKIVGKETNSIRIFLHYLRFCVIFLIVDGVENIVVYIIDWGAKLCMVTTFQESLCYATFLDLHCIDIRKKYLRIVA